MDPSANIAPPPPKQAMPAIISLFRQNNAKDNKPFTIPGNIPGLTEVGPHPPRQLAGF